ncbi:MAG TPA: outer membrane protein assembly factor BamB [Methylococcaceae bacterium]|nr:outer membrane protein assembly factor BamB [Methylococcaceae bacterium]
MRALPEPAPFRRLTASQSAPCAWSARRLGMLLAAALLLSGCTQVEALKEGFSGFTEYFGGKDNAQPPSPLKPLDKEIPVKVLWKDSVGDGYEGQFLDLVPAVDGDYLYVASHDGRVEARERSSGRVLWRKDTGLPISGGVTLGRDYLVFGTRDAEVVAFNVADGSSLWSNSVTSEVLSLPKVADGVVVVRTTDGRIAALDEKTGAKRWVHERSVPALSLRVVGSPAVVNDKIIDGYASGKLIALHAQDGKQEWESVVSRPHGRSEIDRLVDLGAEPAVQGDEVYVVGYNSGVASVAAGNGEGLWHQEDYSAFAGPAATRRALFLTDDDSDVWRLDIRNGGDLWRQGDLHQRRLSAPLVYRDYLVVGDFEGYVHFLSQDDGRIVARTQVGREAIGSRLVTDGAAVYVYGTGGDLAALVLE